MKYKKYKTKICQYTVALQTLNTMTLTTLETEETIKRERNSNSHKAVLDSSTKRRRGSSTFTVSDAVSDDFCGAKTRETAMAQNMEECQLLVASLASAMVDVLNGSG